MNEHTNREPDQKSLPNWCGQAGYQQDAEDHAGKWYSKDRQRSERPFRISSGAAQDGDAGANQGEGCECVEVRQFVYTSKGVARVADRTGQFGVVQRCERASDARRHNSLPCLQGGDHAGQHEDTGAQHGQIQRAETAQQAGIGVDSALMSIGLCAPDSCANVLSLRLCSVGLVTTWCSMLEHET